MCCAGRPTATSVHARHRGRRWASSVNALRLVGVDSFSGHDVADSERSRVRVVRMTIVSARSVGLLSPFKGAPGGVPGRTNQPELAPGSLLEVQLAFSRHPVAGC